jgi:hypothetical protein
MSFIRTKTVKGNPYYYLVKSVREGKKVKQEIVQYFGTTLPPDYVVPSQATAPAPKATTAKVSTTPSPIVPTYRLVKSVRELLGNKRSILKDFGTTLPSDEAIVAAIGTTPIPEGTAYYLVEKGTRRKEKILKSYADIEKLVSTTTAKQA